LTWFIYYRHICWCSYIFWLYKKGCRVHLGWGYWVWHF
jgi:hypothetical protein